jgi:hypothetical protein
MSAATVLTRLYPPAVRERWGAEISDEVSASGIRSWPDTVAGAGRLWLHPSDWPETVPGQTRRVLAVAVFTVTAATALLLRATEQPPTLTADLAHPATSTWLALILLGVGIGTPIPPLRWPALRRLTSDTIRTLTAPAAAILAMLVLANSGLVEHPTGFTHAALIVYYWATLAFTAWRLCALTARLAPAARMPTRTRLRTALLLLGAGLAFAAAQSAVAVAWSRPHAGSVTLTLALGLLATATIRVGHDLRSARPQR